MGRGVHTHTHKVHPCLRCIWTRYKGAKVGVCCPCCNISATPHFSIVAAFLLLYMWSNILYLSQLVERIQRSVARSQLIVQTNQTIYQHHIINLLWELWDGWEHSKSTRHDVRLNKQTMTLFMMLNNSVTVIVRSRCFFPSFSIERGIRPGGAPAGRHKTHECAVSAQPSSLLNTFPSLLLISSSWPTACNFCCTHCFPFQPRVPFISTTGALEPTLSLKMFVLSPDFVRFFPLIKPLSRFKTLKPSVRF